VWLLLKALEFCKAGHQIDLSLKLLCTHLRMALDDRDAGQKLFWFLTNIEPAPSLDQFELALRFNADKGRTVSAGAELDRVRAIDSLLNNHPRPDKGHVPFWLPLPFPPADPEQSLRQTFDWALAGYEQGDPILFQPSEHEDEFQVLEVTVNEQSTPPQAAKEARGIAFQTQEDQQFLPFSWNRLRPDEAALLQSSIRERLRDPEQSRKLLAAVSALALCLRRSMQTIESVKLSTLTTEDWQLDLQNGRLHRFPSRRGVRWQPNENAEPWVRPLGHLWIIELSPDLTAILSAAARKYPQAQTIKGLWADQELSLEAAFNRLCREVPGLDRVSSGLLVHQPEQLAFEQSLDHTFARLITSPSRAGIPGAGAYPSWNSRQVAAAFGLFAGTVGKMAVDSPDQNSLGSELDPDDRLIGESFARLRNRINTLDENSDWIGYHNHLTAYTVLLLLASTGARPVTSIFESIRQFDLEQHHIYIEDKASRNEKDGTAGRLVPMVQSVSAFLKKAYLPYLRHLADGLSTWLPAVSVEVEAQSEGLGSEKLPLFVLFKRKPEFDWVEINETSLRAMGLIDWPLPLNLFRHRLATRLRISGLDPEIIDAQLGHAESGSETYGDYSARCWSTDSEPWSAALAQCLSMLEVGDVRLSFLPITPVELPTGYKPFVDEDTFGRAARKQQRDAQKIATQRAAQEEIDRFVNSRPVDSISAKEWEILGRRMLLTEHNIRQPNASTRYEVFEAFLKREWRENGRRPSLKKWLATLPKPQSIFLPQSIGATQRLHKVRKALDLLFTELPQQPSMSLAGTVAALDLCLFGQVSTLKTLEALATADRSRVRLVIFQQQAYIEYSEWLGQVDSPPVQRFLLPSRSARLTDLALSSTKSSFVTDSCQKVLQEMAKTAGLTAGTRLLASELLRHLAQEVSQENARLLPGVVSGVLAGRVTSSALPWGDWIRSKTGEARVPSDAAVSAERQSETYETEEPISPRSFIGVSDVKNRDRNKNANRQFLGAIRSVLNEYLASKFRPKTALEAASTRTNTDTAARRNARTRIEQVLQKPDRAVSVAVFALGAWVLHLLYRPYRKGVLDAASVRRYMGSLSHGFLSFGCEVDLADMDSEELTEFYRCVLEGGDTSSDHDTNDEVEEQPEENKPRRSERYVLQRLEEFHRFAMARFGLESPDWSEVSDGVMGSLSNPGTITELEYLNALQSLCPDPYSCTTISVRNAFLLLLTFRFGLRGGEAIGMRWRDWVDLSGAVVVLVSGKHRQLKTRGSQRQVPLLEQLTDLEKSVIHRWHAHWTAESGNNESVPLFFDEYQRQQIAEIRPIRTSLLQALRLATGDPATTLHHARHAFANRAFSYLALPIDVDMWPFQDTQDCTVALSARRMLLSTDRTTRRSSWAVARALGHATPTTTYCSYLHIHYDWASKCVAHLHAERFSVVKLRKCWSAVNLDAWVPQPRLIQSNSSEAVPTPRPCTPSLLLKYCRLRAQGYPARSSQEKCQLADKDWGAIEQSLESAGRRIAPGEIDIDTPLARLALPLALLGRIHWHRWQILIDFAKAKEKNKPPPTSKSSIVNSQQIGRSRQILLWSEEHFEQLRQFVDWAALTGDQVIIYRPARLDDRVIQWAKNTGFPKLRNLISDNGTKVFQLDTATEERTEQPPVVHPHRVAATLGQTSQVIKDNYELILFWLVFTSTQQSTNSDGGSIR
jgi:integrase